jgi:hypothetical protein
MIASFVLAPHIYEGAASGLGRLAFTPRRQTHVFLNFSAAGISNQDREDGSPLGERHFNNGKVPSRTVVTLFPSKLLSAEFPIRPSLFSHVTVGVSNWAANTNQRLEFVTTLVPTKTGFKYKLLPSASMAVVDTSVSDFPWR